MRSKKAIDFLYRLCIISLLIIIIIQPDIDRPLFTFFYDNTLWVIIAMVGLGMFFMLLKNTSLIYFSLFSAAILTFYLKGISNNNLMYSSENNGNYTFNIFHYNAEEYGEDRTGLLKDILNSEADIISVGEIPPDLNKFLKTKLKKDYPFSGELNRIDFNSKLIFSKYDILTCDTIYLGAYPQLSIGFMIYNKPVNILFPYILPFEMTGNIKENQVVNLTDIVNNIRNEALIVIGEFNQVYWSKEMRDFIYSTKLNNARRFVYAIADRNPYNHIFYTDHVNCISFEDLYDKNSNRIGIKASFELSNDKKLAYYKKP
ncbi:MAG: endonuclease/exonuclease/phosphatase family protein [Saprospiraceae bacterium]|nr:endonuclease/exonuclease/phosphatase family protein [Saprospiraceae bacterium]